VQRDDFSAACRLQCSVSTSVQRVGCSQHCVGTSSRRCELRGMAAEVVHARTLSRKALLPLHLKALHLEQLSLREDEDESVASMFARQSIGANAHRLTIAIEELLQINCTWCGKAKHRACWGSGTGKTSALNDLLAATEVSPSVYSARFIERQQAVEALLAARELCEGSDSELDQNALDSYVRALTQALECCLHEAKEELQGVFKEVALLRIQKCSASI
jgi:hypothetical protein